MTTRVSIINHGPDAITVGAESLDGNTGSAPVRVEKGAFIENLYVHSTQKLVIKEVKDN